MDNLRIPDLPEWAGPLRPGMFLVIYDPYTDATYRTRLEEIAPAPALVASATKTDVTARGGTNGSITVNAAGGVPPYQYRLNSLAYQNLNLFNNLAAGTYAAWVKDGKGATASVQVTVEQPAEIVTPPVVTYNRELVAVGAESAVTTDGVYLTAIAGLKMRFDFRTPVADTATPQIIIMQNGAQIGASDYNIAYEGAPVEFEIGGTKYTRTFINNTVTL